MLSKSNKKIIVTLLVLSVILSFCHLITHYDHECTHINDCPVCVLIQQTNNNFLILGPNMPIVMILNIIFSCGTLFNIIITIFEKRKTTLVGLKVQMNN